MEIKINLPDLYPKQKAAIMCSHRYAFIEGSTKSGKTAGLMVWQVSQALQRVGMHWWVAPTYKVAKIAYRRIYKDYEHSGIIKSNNESNLELHFINGSILQFRSAEKPDNLYGEDVQSLVIDEASRISQAAWTACRSTVTATNGKIRAIGNVKGKGNWFYKACRKAESNNKNQKTPIELVGSRYTKLTAQDAVDAGILKASELELAKADLPEDVYKELYECIPIDAGSNPFGYENLKKAEMKEFSKLPAVVYGIDVARKKDYFVITGLDREGRQTCEHRFQLPYSEAYKIVRQTVPKGVPVMIDATGVGDAVAEELKTDLSITPFIYSNQSKQSLMQTLQVGFQRGEIKIAGKHTIAELNEFEYSYTSQSRLLTYSAPEGLHDDCVMALAMAYYHGQKLGLISTEKMKNAGQIPATKQKRKTNLRNLI